MNEIRLNKLLNKIYYEYLDSHEAEEFIIYFKRLKNENERLNNIIDELESYLEEQIKYNYKLDDYVDAYEQTLNKLKELKQEN